MTVLSYNPFLFKALVMLPTDSSKEATMAAYFLLSKDEKLGDFWKKKDQKVLTFWTKMRL